jgi:hypothetical protein
MPLGSWVVIFLQFVYHSRDALPWTQVAQWTEDFVPRALLSIPHKRSSYVSIFHVNSRCIAGIVPHPDPVISRQPHFPAILPFVEYWSHEKIVTEKELIVEILSDGNVGEYQIGVSHQGVAFFMGFGFQMPSVRSQCRKQSGTVCKVGKGFGTVPNLVIGLGAIAFMSSQ